jgi:hypothetical protein
MKKMAEEKFLDDLDKIVSAHEKNFSTEILAMLLVGRAASLLSENGLEPAEIIGSVALGADFVTVKELTEAIEKENSALICPLKREEMN